MQPTDYNALSEKFMKALYALHQSFFRQTATPIPANHFLVLLLLRNEGPSNTTRMGQRLGMSKQQLSPIIDKLVKNGCISKKSLPEDRRCSVISLAEGGNAILSRNCEELRMRFHDRLDQLSPQEIEHFAVSIDIFTTSINKMFIHQLATPALESLADKA